MSIVKVCDCSSSRIACSRFGSSLFASTKFTHQTMPSLSYSCGMFGREVQRDKRRIGPVDQPRRQAVMLPEREPVPHRIDARRRLRVRVLAEVAQQRQLERVDARLPCQPQQAVRQFVCSRCEAAERVRRTETLQLGVPRPGEQHLVQFAPRLRSIHIYLASPSALHPPFPPPPFPTLSGMNGRCGGQRRRRAVAGESEPASRAQRSLDP